MSGKYILDGHVPIPCQDIFQWAQWFEKHKSDWSVAASESGEAMVSTVFTGLDYQFGEGDPLLFETMVFGGPNNGVMDRCSTWEEAEKMHQAMCLKLEIPCHDEGE